MADRKKKKGLSGLYILLILFALMIMFGGPALIRMINIILFGQCNVAPEAAKIKASIEKVCRGQVGDFELVDYPSCPVLMSCDTCTAAVAKAGLRSVIGAAQTLRFYKSVKALATSARNGAKSIANAPQFIKDLRGGFSASSGQWWRPATWKEVYQYAKWDAGAYRATGDIGSIEQYRQRASALTQSWTSSDYTKWQNIASDARTVYEHVTTAALGAGGKQAVWKLASRSKTTGVYVFIASDPYNLRPDLRQKAGEAADAVLENVESILCDPAAASAAPTATPSASPSAGGGGCGAQPAQTKQDATCGSEGTVILPIGLDEYLITKKEADPSGKLAELAVRARAQQVYSEAHDLAFRLNAKLISLFTSVNDQIYANQAFGQGSCMQPSSQGFNAIPSTYSRVEGACTTTSTVTKQNEDCGDPATDPDFSKCANPTSVADQDLAVDKSAGVFLNANHVFRFMDDLKGFLLSRADAIAKKNPARKTEIAAAGANIKATLEEAMEKASNIDNPWYYAYLSAFVIAGDIAKLNECEAITENSLIGWYKEMLDTMSAVNELVSGKFDTGGVLVDEGLEQKQMKLLKIRNEAFDILLKNLPAGQLETKTTSDAQPITITYPLYSVISSCNYEDRLLSGEGGCDLSAVNLEKKKEPVGAGGFQTMYAIPIASLEYGTTMENWQVPIGFISGMVGGTAGRAIATLGFALQNCPAGGPLSADSDKTLIFCMKPATPVCALPGGCEVCFAAKCNTKIGCSSVGAANLRVEKRSTGCTELTGPVKPI